VAYQPRWVRGATIDIGDRDCAARYEVIRVLLSPYTRTITVWDLGANLGYFGLRLASEFGAVAVMVDSRPELVNVCQDNGLPTTIALTHRLSVQDLAEVAASEAPDVVLALNVLHHFADWRGALEAVLGLADRVILETPGRGDVNSANYAEAMRLLDAVEALGEPVAASFPSHVTPGVKRPMFLIDRVKGRVTSGYAYVERVRARGKHPVRPHRILRDFHMKTIAYDDGEARAWYPGMNLWNWAQLGGAWPRSLLGRADVAYLGRGPMHPETGYVGFRIPQALPLLDWCCEAYLSERFRTMTDGWTDCHILRAGLKAVPVRSVDLTRGRYSGDSNIWPSSPLASRLDHAKGVQRKRESDATT
jgi:hypothetical protein